MYAKDIKFEAGHEKELTWLPHQLRKQNLFSEVKDNMLRISIIITKWLW